MRVALRLLGLDLLEFTVEAESATDDEPGDCTTTAVGFTLPEHPTEYEVPDRE